MKTRLLICLLLSVLLLLGLSGCGIGAMARSAGNAAEAAVESGAAAMQSSSKPGELIAKDKAVEIALQHAGFQAEQVKYLRAEYEIDDGIPQYEVQFHQDRWEYDYEINAQTGDIMSWDKDD